MNSDNLHYSDYASRSAAIPDIEFHKVCDEDKAMIGQVRKIHIKKNIGLMIFMIICFVGFLLYFLFALEIRLEYLFADLFSVILLFVPLAVAAYYVIDVLGPLWRIRKGVVIRSERVTSTRYTGNATYQYFFDIYLPDSDQTLMNFQVDREVFGDIDPGDGVILVKNIWKIRVFADPDRIAVMDVSRITSGVDRRK